MADRRAEIGLDVRASGNAPDFLRGIANSLTKIDEQVKALGKTMASSLANPGGPTSSSSTTGLGFGQRLSEEDTGRVREMIGAIRQAGEAALEAAGRIQTFSSTLNQLLANAYAAAQQSAPPVQQEQPLAKKPWYRMGFAMGGTVEGPGGTDNVPIMASRGEEIINARDASRHRNLLKSINSGHYAVGYATGGIPKLYGARKMERTAINKISHAIGSRYGVELSDLANEVIFEDMGVNSNGLFQPLGTSYIKINSPGIKMGWGAADGGPLPYLMRTLAHEFGHGMDWMLGRRYGSYRPDFLSNISRDFKELGVYRAEQQSKYRPHYNYSNMGYGYEEHPKEGFADLFADTIINPPNHPRVLPPHARNLLQGNFLQEVRGAISRVIKYRPTPNSTSKITYRAEGGGDILEPPPIQTSKHASEELEEAQRKVFKWYAFRYPFQAAQSLADPLAGLSKEEIISRYGSNPRRELPEIFGAGSPHFILSENLMKRLAERWGSLSQLMPEAAGHVSSIYLFRNEEHPNVLGKYNPYHEIFGNSKRFAGSIGLRNDPQVVFGTTFGHELIHAEQELQNRLIPSYNLFSPKANKRKLEYYYGSFHEVETRNRERNIRRAAQILDRYHRFKSRNPITDNLVDFVRENRTYDILEQALTPTKSRIQKPAGNIRGILGDAWHQLQLSLRMARRYGLFGFAKYAFSHDPGMGLKPEKGWKKILNFAFGGAVENDLVPHYRDLLKTVVAAERRTGTDVDATVPRYYTTQNAALRKAVMFASHNLQSSEVLRQIPRGSRYIGSGGFGIAFQDRNGIVHRLQADTQGLNRILPRVFVGQADLEENEPLASTKRPNIPEVLQALHSGRYKTRRGYTHYEQLPFAPEPVGDEKHLRYELDDLARALINRGYRHGDLKVSNVGLHEGRLKVRDVGGLQPLNEWYGFRKPAGSCSATRMASGGVIGMHPGEPKGTDTIPAWLTPNEFVINARSSQANRALLHRINEAKGPLQMASGGVAYLAGGGIPIRQPLITIGELGGFFGGIIGAIHQGFAGFTLNRQLTSAWNARAAAWHPPMLPLPPGPGTSRFRHQVLSESKERGENTAAFINQATLGITLAKRAFEGMTETLHAVSRAVSDVNATEEQRNRALYESVPLIGGMIRSFRQLREVMSGEHGEVSNALTETTVKRAGIGAQAAADARLDPLRMQANAAQYRADALGRFAAAPPTAGMVKGATLKEQRAHEEEQMRIPSREAGLRAGFEVQAAQQSLDRARSAQSARKLEYEKSQAEAARRTRLTINAANSPAKPSEVGGLSDLSRTERVGASLWRWFGSPLAHGIGLGGTEPVKGRDNRLAQLDRETVRPVSPTAETAIRGAGQASAADAENAARDRYNRSLEETARREEELAKAQSGARQANIEGMKAELEIMKQRESRASAAAQAAGAMRPHEFNRARRAAETFQRNVEQFGAEEALRRMPRHRLQAARGLVSDYVRNVEEQAGEARINRTGLRGRFSEIYGTGTLAQQRQQIAALQPRIQVEARINEADLAKQIAGELRKLVEQLIKTSKDAVEQVRRDTGVGLRTKSATEASS